MPNRQPFFSIVTCTKNSARFLPTCLNSLFAQTFRDFEHIVIDGESTDKTLSLIPKSSQLSVLPPIGISAAMNEGIKRAKGRYIYFLHSDDYLHNNSVLSNVANFLQDNPDLDWVYGQIQTIDVNDNKLGIFPKYLPFQVASKLILKYFNFIPHQATFVKKTVFSQFGLFSPAYKSCMDYDLWLRIAKNTRWKYMPILVANYRIHANSQSSSLLAKEATQHESQYLQDRANGTIERLLSRLFNSILNNINKMWR